MSGADQRGRRPSTWTRIWTYCFMGALLVLTVVLVVAAVTAGPGDRDRFIGMAVFVGTFALAGLMLVWGVERRLRNGSR